VALKNLVSFLVNSCISLFETRFQSLLIKLFINSFLFLFLPNFRGFRAVKGNKLIFLGTSLWLLVTLDFLICNLLYRYAIA
jgi:hypothetical protein